MKRMLANSTKNESVHFYKKETLFLAKQYKKYFSHPNIIPELGFSLPSGVDIKAGIEDITEVAIRASLFLNMFSGKLEFENLIKMIENARITIPVMVNVTSNKSGNITTFNCLSKALNGETPSNIWYLNGKSLENKQIGDTITFNTKQVAKIENISNDRLQLKFLKSGKYGISCVATTEENDKGADTLNLTVD